MYETFYTSNTGRGFFKLEDLCNDLALKGYTIISHAYVPGGCYYSVLTFKSTV